MLNNNQLVIDARMINSSGIGRYLQNILPSIILHFKNVKLLGDIEELQKYTHLDHIIDFTTPIYSIKEQLEYKKYIPECDLFFSPHYNVPLLPIKAKFRITTIHDVFHLAFYKELTFAQKIYSKYVINKALNNSDRVITVSEFSKQEIIKYTSLKHINKIQVIHNGIDEVTKNQIKSRKNKSYFLFVGNVKPHKNLARVVKAYRLFADKNASNENCPQFIIIGKKDGFITVDNNIIQVIEDDPILKKNVTFTGWVSDEILNQYYRNALCLVFPSYYEGFGFPPLEAMITGTPCIVSNSASIPEICNNAAIYFDPFDIEDIFMQMNLIFNDTNLQQDLRIKGEANIKRFSWTTTCERHIELFESILSRKQ